MASNYNAISEYNILQLGLDTESRKSQVSMYSDSTHFIFEILQNADDYGATEVSFYLEEKRLIIEHNGIPFTEENVKAITYFGKSTSADDLVKTGRFGIGFKSVFAFTATPEIISGDEHFQIFDLYKIGVIERPVGFDQNRTRIVLPFNHLTHRPNYVEQLLAAQDAYDKISVRLEGLDKKTLLFTRNIRIIEWQTQEKAGFYSRTDEISSAYRISTISDQLKGSEDKFLVFHEDVTWKDDDRILKYKPIELAFYLDEADEITTGSSVLYVLFSTIQETHLKFVLNGPFRTNPSRESIAHDDSFNQHLIQLLCKRLPHIFEVLKTEGYISPKFLNVLPNDDDELPVFYQPIRKTLYQLYKTVELLPAEHGDFVKSASARTGPQKLKAQFSDEDLAFLIGEIARWIKNPQSGSRGARFLSSIGVLNWGWYELVNALKTRFADRSLSWFSDREKKAAQEAKQWLLLKEPAWLQKLYILLAEGLATGSIRHEYDYRANKEKAAPFVDSLLILIDTQTGLDIESISNTRFPKEGYTNCVSAPILNHPEEPIAKIIRQSLETLGIHEVSEADEISNLIKDKYSKSSTPIVDETWITEHFNDLERFIRFSADTGKSDIFRKSNVLLADTQTLQKPTELYIDTPIQDTGLKALYDLSIPGIEQKDLLWEGYSEIFDEDFERFLSAIGVTFELQMERQSTWKNPYKEDLRRDMIGRPSHLQIDRDYKIQGIETLVTQNNILISKLLWTTMTRAEPKYLKAEYRLNAQYSVRTAPSYLVSVLTTNKWIPDSQGNFKAPDELNTNSLHPDLSYDDSNGWLTAIGFEKTREHIQENEDLAQQLGFDSAAELEEVQKLIRAAKEKGMSLVDMKGALGIHEKPARPVANPTNIQSAITQTRQTYQQSNRKVYVETERSVREAPPTQDIKDYLRRVNNSEGKIVCQLCHEVMPFKYQNQYYFEAVEFLDRARLPREYHKQYLALCPNCAAKYKLFVKQDDGQLEDIKLAVIELMLSDDPAKPSDELEISVITDRVEELWFTKQHLIDLKTILEETKSRE